MMRISHAAIILVLFSGLLASCATTIRGTDGRSAELDSESYATGRDTKGTVLLAINWGRRWACGGYENAELRGIFFDRIPPVKISDAEAADLSFQESPNPLSHPEFINYAVLVEPGDYALSGFIIKVAISRSNIDYWIAKRSELIKDGKTLGGSFRVAAGEAVYIGNFSLDCDQVPQLWRYYTAGSDHFNSHLAEFKEKYPFLNIDGVRYRLFETNTLGLSYQLK